MCPVLVVRCGQHQGGREKPPQRVSGTHWGSFWPVLRWMRGKSPPMSPVDLLGVAVGGVEVDGKEKAPNESMGLVGGLKH